VAEAHAVGTDPGQPGGRGRIELPDAPRAPRQQLCGGEHLLEVTGVADRGHEEEVTRRLRQVRHPAREGLLEPSGERNEAVRDPVDGAVVGRERQLQQTERVAGGRAEHGTAGRCREARGRPVQQGRGSPPVERADQQVGHPRLAERIVPDLPRRGQDQDRIGGQAPGREGEDLGRRSVQPLRVVHEDGQRCCRGERCPQVQAGERDAEDVRRGLRRTERTLQRLTATAAQTRDVGADGPQELVQPGEGQEPLGRRPVRPQDAPTAA
jgi:hypothetical protein